MIFSKINLHHSLMYKPQSNTFEVFQDGSGLIHNSILGSKSVKKGKLDISFTSPPYFNREQYSQMRINPSKYGEYDDWR